MADYDPDELLALVIEAVAENLPGDDAEVLELPVAPEGAEGAEGEVVMRRHWHV